MATHAAGVRRTIPRRFANRIRRWPWRRIIAASAVALAAIIFIPPLRTFTSRVVGNVVLFVLAPFAPATADFSKLPSGTQLIAADGSTIGELGEGGLRAREPVALASLPEHVRNAFLAAEDKDFYHHGGVDPAAVTRAALSTLRGNTQGGSTITQQLAKLNYTAGERTVFRKLRELLYASKLERRYTKDELLERYINQVYFGDGAYGLGVAARGYFGTTPDKLSPSQAAVLAGKIRSPEGLNPRTDPRDVTRRRNQVLVNMKREGWLDDKTYDASVAEPLVVIPKVAATAGLAPHFVTFVEREAKKLDALGASPQTRAAQLFTGGYRIQTTFDPKTYEATVASVQARLGAAGDPVTAVATVVPGDGAIRSLFGGLDFASTQFDMSSRGGRQAGSAFKPFVYMAALRDKIDPRSTFDGTSGRVIPCYGSTPVNNYAGEDAGGVLTVDDALVHSVNVVFVDLGCHVGVNDVVRAATDDGIPDDATTAQGAVFLGGLHGKGVNALAMASAYATFGANGMYAEPYAIAKIVDRDDHVIYEHKAKTHRAFSEDEVGVINRPLQGVVKEGTGVAAKIGRPVGGKTGTTQDNIDAWFNGFTPDLATSVWTGYAQPKPMQGVHGRSVTGGSFPAQIFSDVMKAAHRGIPVHSLPTRSPDGLDLHMISAPASTTSSSLPVDTTMTIIIGEPTDTTQRRPPRSTTSTPSSTTTRPKRSTTTSTPTTTTQKPKGAGATTTTSTSTPKAK
jgi:membrane peptidoglycan carboxypeptidase